MCDSINSAIESQRADGVAMGTIYSITCLINGKPYVGQTRQPLKRRISQHKCNSSRIRPGIDAAIAKYGWENFTLEVLEVCPVEMLNERECFWIKKLNSKVPNGYNITEGGNGLKGHSPSAETRAKLAIARKGKPAWNKGKHHSAKTKALMSAAQSGQNNPQYGKHPSPETCAKIAAAHKGKKHSAESRAKMSVSQKARREREKAIENGGDK